MKRVVTKFQDIVGRITGFSFSTQIFGIGISWNPPTPEIEIARKLITFLEDRRALYAPYDHENIIFVQESILEIRQRLTFDLEQLDRSSSLAGLLKQMRTACRSFLHKTQEVSARDAVYGSEKNWNREARAFFGALGELRATIGICIGEICVRYGIDVEEQLAELIPPSDDSIPNHSRFPFDF